MTMAIMIHIKRHVNSTDIKHSLQFVNVVKRDVDVNETSAANLGL